MVDVVKVPHPLLENGVLRVVPHVAPDPEAENNRDAAHDEKLVLGLLGGSAGTASLVSMFWNDDEEVQFGLQQMMGVFQGALVVAQSLIAVQNYELRSIRHNDTAGDCAEFENEVDLVLNDQQVGQHDVVQTIMRLTMKKTDIEQNAPHL